MISFLIIAGGISFGAALFCFWPWRHPGEPKG
jgi:hypothetical protein